MGLLKSGDHWPLSTKDEERIKRYKENKLLFEGDHVDVFKNVQRKIESIEDIDSADKVAMTYLVCNFAGLLSKVSADMLFGENPKIKNETDATNERTEEMIRDNSLYTNFYESALGNSYRGDSCFKIKYAKRSKYANERDVIIEPQNPEFFFVETEKNNVRKVNRKIIGFTKKIANEKYLQLEIHEPGTIYNQAYRMIGNVISSQVDIKMLDEGLEEVIETGIDDFLLVHVPNWRTDTEYWGYSDYLDIKSLQDECNNRISQISKILDKHADPNMRGPAEYGDDVDVGGKYFPYSDETVKPEYMVWEAKLKAAFDQIDYILKMLFLVTETSPDAFGLSEGGIAESGRALKFRLMRLLSKIARKKRYYDHAIKKALVIAQKLDNEHNGQNYKVEEPSITWRDGLPDDPKEKAETTESLDRASAMSTEEKVRYNHPDWSEQRIQDEISRIEAEKAEERTAPVL